MTINGARGFTQTIADRIDLTHECVRRYHLDEWSPLTEVFGRYAGFFSLFEDFRAYTDFFLLHDLVTPDYEAVAFFNPFENFERSGRPRDLSTYLEFRERSIAFIHARNRRIERYCSELARGRHE